MHYRLRTLLILLAVGPPVLGGAWIVGGPMVQRWLRPDEPGLQYGFGNRIGPFWIDDAGQIHAGEKPGTAR